MNNRDSSVQQWSTPGWLTRLRIRRSPARARAFNQNYAALILFKAAMYLATNVRIEADLEASRVLSQLWQDLECELDHRTCPQTTVLL